MVIFKKKVNSKKRYLFFDFTFFKCQPFSRSEHYSIDLKMHLKGIALMRAVLFAVETQFSICS